MQRFDPETPQDFSTDLCGFAPCTWRWSDQPLGLNGLRSFGNKKGRRPFKGSLKGQELQRYHAFLVMLCLGMMFPFLGNLKGNSMVEVGCSMLN